jgi:hypothetical protein
MHLKLCFYILGDYAQVRQVELQLREGIINLTEVRWLQDVPYLLFSQCFTSVRYFTNQVTLSRLVCFTVLKVLGFDIVVYQLTS